MFGCKWNFVKQRVEKNVVSGDEELHEKEWRVRASSNQQTVKVNYERGKRKSRSSPN